MADEDILSRWKPGPSVPPKDPSPPSSDGDIFSRWKPGQAASSPPAQPPSKPTKPSGSWLTRPISESLAGTSAGKEYQVFVDRLLPKTIQKEKGGAWMKRFSAEILKAGPEVADFIQSPVGMALVAGHMFPATAPFAAAIDLGLGGMGMFQAIPEVGKAFSEGTPEAWAGAIKDIAMSAGMLKGGARTLASRSKMFHAEPLAERNALREDLVRTEDLQGKVHKLDEAKIPAKPNTIQKISRYAYDNAFLREPAKWANITKPRLMQVSADIVADKANFLALRNFEINHLLYDFKREVPVGDREIQKLGYVIQGDATPDEVGLSKQAREWLPRIREFVANQDKILREAYGDDLPLQESENYLTQVWDLADKGVHHRQAATRTQMNDPYLKKRTIDSYKDGIEKYGLKPKYNDVADLLKRRADFASKAIANRRMAQWLRDMGAIVNENEFRELGQKSPSAFGWQQPQNSEGVPHGGYKRPGFGDWRQATEANALYRAAYSNTPMDGGIVMKPVYVHPDFADAVNAVYGKGFDHPAFLALDTIRSLGKKASLSLSMFHHWALSEQAHAIHATRSGIPTTLSKTFFFNPEFYRGMKSMAWNVFGRESKEAPPVMRLKKEMVGDWIEDGMNLHSEEQESHLTLQLEQMQSSNNRFLKKLGKVGGVASNAMKHWDRPLWDYYHQGMMLDAAETIWADEAMRLHREGVDAKDRKDPRVMERRRTVTEHVNNAFGAISYEKMLLSPKARQAMNFMLLAPAWTISNFRVLTSGFENEAGMRLANKYVKGAAISMFASMQSLNYATSGWWDRDKDGKPKPRWTWENEGAPVKLAGKYLQGLNENSFRIYAGRNKDGSERYVILGKGFIEPLMWALAPIETLAGKLSQPIRMAMVQATGSTPGSGYQEIDMNAPTGEKLAQRGVSAMEGMGLPFIFRDSVKDGLHKAFPESVRQPVSSSSFAFLPARKGISFTKAKEAYRDAMDSGALEQAQQVLSYAAKNKIDPKRITNAYRQEKRAKQRQVRGPAITYDIFGDPENK